MAENSKIEWTDHTFNPWIGCTKVSPGCANCYAEAQMDNRLGQVAWGPHGTRKRTGAANWAKPLRWNARCDKEIFLQCDGCGVRKFVTPEQCEESCDVCGDISGVEVRPRVFCASLADVFEDWQGPIVDAEGDEYRKCACGWSGLLPVIVAEYRGNVSITTCPKCNKCETASLTMDDLRRDLFALIDATPNLDCILLTKRPENIRRMWPDWRKEALPHVKFESDLRPNVWLLTSVENQTTADERIPELLKCRDLVPVLGLSCEPLLGPVDLKFWNPNNPQSQGQWLAALEGVGVIGKNRPVDWVIAGGESGPGARPMHPEWARSLRDQCATADVPFLHKQNGEYTADVDDDTAHEMMRRYTHSQLNPEAIRYFRTPTDLVPAGFGCSSSDYVTMYRVGKKAAGRLLDGVQHDGFPTAHLQAS